ncbi:Protein of unknown function DUF247, plant [Dillenia turbinata]|uniref:Uncharacterized protein n=1 Tax=Dillenia turbinata TaxID=194707 RepID=A0AAN8UL95_9MAGN
MDSSQTTMNSNNSKWNSGSAFDELRWIIQIRQTLDEELEEECEIPVCIFNVPKALSSSDPDSYTPQEVAIGPYHHWRTELYEMERYKLSAAKKTQKQLQTRNFQSLVEHLMKLEQRIRACYHKYLDFNGETLAWMMAIDASFLLEFLQIYAIKGERELTRVSSRMSHLFDFHGTKSAHNAILRDIAMLENQVPLFVLRKILEFQFSSVEFANGIFISMLMGFCKCVSPIVVREDSKNIDIKTYTHVLDFLYHMIVPKNDDSTEMIVVDANAEDKDEKEGSSTDSSYIKQLFEQIWSLLSKLNKGLVRLIKALVISRLFRFILKLPWTIISNLPGFHVLKTPVESYFFAENKEDIKPENQNSSFNSNISKPPLVEEITIPSVSQLCKVGVTFLPASGGISSIDFDVKSSTMYLPVVNLDVNAEIIMRNLVAYEASLVSGPLVFTRYTELMNGIIDTEEDAKLLREKGIVMNRLKKDEEVASLWNGMSKSIKLTKVPSLDKVIEDVNKYYNNRWKVRAGKFVKTYVFGSWRLLTFMAAIFLLLLLTLQAFCSVYSCARLLRISSN